MMAAQEILELYCELIVVRLPIIETQRLLFSTEYQLPFAFTIRFWPLVIFFLSVVGLASLYGSLNAYCIRSNERDLRILIVDSFLHQLGYMT